MLTLCSLSEKVQLAKTPLEEPRRKANKLILQSGEPVDLDYNRLTDFAFECPQNAALRDPYLADAVVLTPHPQAHAFYADKRNLVALTDESWLREIGISDTDCQVLKAGIPCTEIVAPEDAARF